MAETTETNNTNATTEATPAPTPKDAAKAEQPTDWKAESRKWEERAKENKANADSYTALKAKFDQLSKSSDDAATKLAAAQKTIADMEAQNKLNALRMKVSKDTGVPVELLTGKDEDTLRSQAKGISDYAHRVSTPKLPAVFSDGKVPKGDASINGWQRVASFVAHNH